MNREMFGTDVPKHDLFLDRDCKFFGKKESPIIERESWRNESKRQIREMFVLEMST